MMRFLPQLIIYVRPIILMLVGLLFGSFIASGQGVSQAQTTFTNPLLTYGPDPWSFYHEGYYYYTHTLLDSIGLWRTRSIADLKNAEYQTIWKPAVGTTHSKNLWAPEIHFLEGKWYVYYAADDGNTDNHRLWVLENASRDPFKGNWTHKGKLSDPSDNWAIDGSVFKHRGKLYLVWSGWEQKREYQETAHIYIAALKNPYTVGSKRVRLSSPQLPWERNWQAPDAIQPKYPIFVNEGPQVLSHGNNIFLVYSASGCWTDTYSLGMLSADAGSDLLNSASWKKSREPVFGQSPADSVYATGHNSFFKSPDGTEDWLLYHANSEPNQGCTIYRSPRAQKISWKKDGTPDFGKPVAVGTPLPLPSRKHNAADSR